MRSLRQSVNEPSKDDELQSLSLPRSKMGECAGGECLKRITMRITEISTEHWAPYCLKWSGKMMTDAEVDRVIQAHPHAPELLEKIALEGGRVVSAHILFWDGSTAFAVRQDKALVFRLEKKAGREGVGQKPHVTQMRRLARANFCSNLSLCLQFCS